MQENEKCLLIAYGVGQTENAMKDIQKQVRTRFAPSPTGYPHIGSIYQALFDFAFAKKYNGSFIVRIEDTDRTRLVEGAEEVIFGALDWFGLTEDESPRKGGRLGPYRQSERLEIYHKYAETLIKKGHAYFSYFPKKEAGYKKDYTNQERINTATAFTTTEEPPKTIAEMVKRGDWVVRMKIPQKKEITVNESIRGNITFPLSEVTEQVLIKSDGFPTYHLAVVVDDHLMEISHVLRAEEWLSSLPKHVLLYNYFNWEVPFIAHTATLRNPDKSKLSKRHGHTNVNWYREEGYLPEAIINYLALLGWHHPEDKEIFSLEEFIHKFHLNAVRPVAPIFDLKKLTWMNGEYIRMMSLEELVRRLIAFGPDNEKNFAPAVFSQLVKLAQERMQTLREFETLTAHFISEPEISTRDEKEKEIAEDLLKTLSGLTQWTSDQIFPALKEVMQRNTVRMPLLYYVTTGSERGLPLPETLEILGKERTLKRLRSL